MFRIETTNSYFHICTTTEIADVEFQCDHLFVEVLIVQSNRGELLFQISVNENQRNLYT